MHAWLVGLLGSVWLVSIPCLNLCIAAFGVSHLVVAKLEFPLQVGVSCLQAVMGATWLVTHLDGSKALLAVVASVSQRVHQQILLVLRGEHVSQKVVLGNLLL